VNRAVSAGFHERSTVGNVKVSFALRIKGEIIAHKLEVIRSERWCTQLARQLQRVANSWFVVRLVEIFASRL
jgi:hypothetical protein